MRVQWKQLLLKALIWLAAESLLTFLGIDNLADYSEFLFEMKYQYEANIYMYCGSCPMPT